MEALQYNSERTPLIIPEYGRHMHVMVDQLLATQDREERNKKAKAIIGVMGNLNPHLRDVPCLLYTSPSPRDLSTSRMPSSA